METYNTYDMTRVAAAFTAALGADAPQQSNEMAEPLADLLMDAFSGKPADRAVLYLPDAIAMWLCQKYTPDFREVLRHTRLTLPLRTVMPSVTPVCFGTMFTGALPEVHGIQKYEKPVIRTDTVFDALIRAGKRCAIVSSVGASMSRIFLEREMDYFVECAGGGEALEVGLGLIAADKYDFLCIYDGWYDHTMHATAVEAPEALAEFRKNTAAFGEIVRAVQKHYARYDTFIGFATDHGCHDHPETGRGTHGTDLPEDLNVLHFYGSIGRSI